MTASVVIGPFKSIKPHAVSWRKSVDNYSDTATIKIPAIAMLRKQGDTYEQVATGQQIKEGMNVTIAAGYHLQTVSTVFVGFVKRVNFTIPLEIECEGYSYELRKRLDFSKSYKNTTVLDILRDVVEGTSITLSNRIPDIPLSKATFVNVTRLQVLEWLHDKCQLTVYFNGKELYAGMQQLEPKATRKFQLGWNVIKDGDLRFNAVKEFADVRIEVSGRKKDGNKNRGLIGKVNGQIKRFKSQITDKNVLEKIAEQKRVEIINRGYEGSITAFLNPPVEPGMAVEITDKRYPERTGRYFVNEVEGSIGPNGGRQKITIGNAL